jgi:transposase
MLTRDEVQTIYDQGPDAVYALVESLWAIIATQHERITALEEQNALLFTRLQQLEARLERNSHNSSKPPSSDGLKKTSKPPNLRQKTDLLPGGQPGHPGHTLEFVDHPDQMLLHAPLLCSTCGSSLQGAPVVDTQSRQVVDLPLLKLQVTEHQALTCLCPHCQSINAGDFPPHVRARVQYGPQLLGLCVYLTEFQLLPLQRTQELLLDLFGQAPSQGTLTEAITHCSQTLQPVETAIKKALLAAKVLHVDETGARVAGKTDWLHVSSTSLLTFYAHDRKRGREALRRIGILPHFQGTSVHDCLRAYFDPSYPCLHSLCNAHLLRELLGLFEEKPQTWTQRMSALLRSLKRAKQKAQSEGKRALDADVLWHYRLVYQRIVARGLRQNPEPLRCNKAGYPFQGPFRNLLLRLQKQEEAVLRFALDFSVPFDNNQAERDLRMVKVQQKISGCFRSVEGAEHFCRIRGYISTLRKQGGHLLEALRSAFAGDPIYPNFETT